MSSEDRVYELLLRMYPTEFRADYAHQMMVVFRDMRREREGIWRFWWRIISDIAWSAPAMRVEISRTRSSNDVHSNGGIMKTISIFAVLVGAITIVNASIEGWMGGLVNHDSQSIIAWCLGGLGGLSLLAAGIMLLRRSSAAITRAQIAATLCLAGFVLMLIISPRLSIFANALGIGFPLVLIAYVQLSRAKGRPTPLVG